MRRLLVVLASVWLAGCASDTDTLKPKDATAFFKPDFEKIYAAWSTLDASKVAVFYAKEPKLVFFDITPLKYNGWQEYEDGFKRVAADWKSGQVTVAPDFHATQLGNVAWATYTLDLVIQPKTGDVIKQQARGTDVLEKRGEQWLIVHEHVSVVMAQDQPKVKAHKAKAPAHAKAKKKRR